MNSLDSQFNQHPFYCPIEPMIYPKVAEIEQRVIAWLDKFQFYKSEADRASLISVKATDLCARITPNAIEENFLNFVQWTYWVFAFDDVIDNAKCETDESSMPAEFAHLAISILGIWENPHAPLSNNNPFFAALQDISQNLRKYTTPAQIQRLTYAQSHWLLGVAWQRDNRSHNYISNVNDYLRLRMHESGGRPALWFIDVANGMEVPIQEMNSPVIITMTEMCSLIAALDNDFISYRKESYHQEINDNIMVLLMYHNHCTLEQAISDALNIRDRLMHLFLCLRDQILPQASPKLRSYLMCLGNVIRGTFEWSLKTPRYNSFGESIPPPFYAQAFTPEWTEHPDIYTEPLPFSTVSWWWDFLKT
jgi:hypothetical protein